MYYLKTTLLVNMRLKYGVSKFPYNPYAANKSDNVYYYAKQQRFDDRVDEK